MCKHVKKYSAQKYSAVVRRVRPADARQIRSGAWLLIYALALLLFPAKGIGQELVFSQPLLPHWQYPTEDTINLTPAAHGDSIYLPLAAGAMVSLRASDGQMIWKSDMGGTFSAAPAADARGAYVATETIATGGQQSFYRATGALRALSSKSGVTLWMHTLPQPIRGALTTSATTIFAGTADGRIYAFDKETGAVKWLAQNNAPFNSQPVLHDGRLYIGSEDGALLVLAEQTGQILWRYQTHGAVRGPVAVANQLVLFGSGDGYVYALDEMLGRMRWRTRTGAGVPSVAATPFGLVVASLDNFVYLLNYRRGDHVWKRQLGGRIAAQPLTNGDCALFVPLGGDAGIVLALHDGKTLNSLEVGADGNTAAAPIIADNVLLLTTRHGLIAFTPSTTTARRPL
jgi:outer membrane protein assembly factor BamB